MQMDNIKKVMTDMGIPESMYKVSMFSHPKIEEKYGEINLVQIPLKNPSGTDLFVIPGYSFRSFTSMFGKMKEGMKYFESKYRNLYMINFGDKVKKDTTTMLSEGMTEEESYVKQDFYREDLAKTLDKCIRNPELNLTNFTLVGKSAGGGVSIFLAGMNKEVKKLLFCCPGITNRGTPLAARPELEIHMGWNIDDDTVEYNINKEIMEQLTKQGNTVRFHGYQKGGHEINSLFIEDVL